ncbi:hypothetical protein HMN09_00965100 [Mycena chlorophos]|uniref:Uncharacterized protein n=1 Tax=Mycena chlorophos TaxID=658473 RepID=A0A8H6VZM3_MYCCL|nr:hypothetical protein HMN09_00965100 [Mycena chlorophos]
MGFISTAKDLRNQCSMDPALSVLQPVATSVLELLEEAAQYPRKRSHFLAEAALRLFSAVVENALDGEIILHDPCIQETLNDVESAIDSMRRLVIDQVQFRENPLRINEVVATFMANQAIRENSQPGAQATELSALVVVLGNWSSEGDDADRFGFTLVGCTSN